jgi:hypothetical protein
MFGPLAPKLRARGWRAIIPIRPREKRPWLEGWQRFNVAPPTDEEIARWTRIYPDSGVGLACGPDRVAALDRDFSDPTVASKAAGIIESICGKSPLIRIGALPKAMHFFQVAPGFTLTGHMIFDGFEIFVSSGQTVLFAIHPSTGNPYRWPDESPLTTSPHDLPIITTQAARELIVALTPCFTKPQRRPGTASGSNRKPDGEHLGLRAASQLLPILRASSDAVEAAAKALASAPEGTRHYTPSAQSWPS